MPQTRLTPADPTAGRDNRPMVWRISADGVLLLHLAFVVFIVAGGFLAGRWPHIAFVQLPLAVYGVVIELVGFRCPLTPLEKMLRRKAGSSGYEGGFVEHYIVGVLYPGELTTGVKLFLACAVAATNTVAYLVVWRRPVRADDDRR